MQVFELIAYLQVGRYFPFSLGEKKANLSTLLELVLEQEQVDKELRSEHMGIIDVAQHALYMMPT